MRTVKLGAILFLAGAVVSARPLREIPTSMKAEEAEGYFSGAGMGQGLPAETFGYPGPKHVLELEKELQLTPEQKYHLEAIYKKMHTDALFYGKKMVAEELALDNFFKSGQTNSDLLANRVEKIGGLKWKLRLTHLTAHLKTRLILTPEQIQKYQALRAAGSPPEKQ